MKLFGAHISGHPFIAPTARIYAPWLLTVGDRSCIATRSEIYNLGPVIIKERVTIAQYAISVMDPMTYLIINYLWL